MRPASLRSQPVTSNTRHLLQTSCAFTHCLRSWMPPASLEIPSNCTMHCKYRRQPYPALKNHHRFSVEFPQELLGPPCKSTDGGFGAKSCVRCRAGNQRAQDASGVPLPAPPNQGSTLKAQRPTRGQDRRRRLPDRRPRAPGSRSPAHRGPAGHPIERERLLRLAASGNTLLAPAHGK